MEFTTDAQYYFNATVWCRLHDSGDPTLQAIASRHNHNARSCDSCGAVGYEAGWTCKPCETRARSQGSLRLPGQTHHGFPYIYRTVARLRHVRGTTVYRPGTFRFRAKGFSMWRPGPSFRAGPGLSAGKVKRIRREIASVITFKNETYGKRIRRIGDMQRRLPKGAK